MKISIVVAMTKDRAIGWRAGLPWGRVASDLKRFRDLTMNHTLIMGRKTFESIGRVLPGRRSIVITRNPNYGASGVTVASSLEDALDKAGGAAEVFVIGGGEIFSLALPIADKLYVTKFFGEFPGDVFFPEFETQWRIDSFLMAAGEKGSREPPHAFYIYSRKTKKEQE